MYRLRGASVTVALLAVFLTPGCLFSPKDDPGPPPPPPPSYVPRTSPENVLKNLENAHLLRDINGYDAQFHDLFRFLVSPYDDIGVPEFSKVEDHESTEHMFDSIDNVEIALDNTGSVPSDSADPLYSAATGHRQIAVPHAFLMIQTREMEGGEPVFLQVPGHPHLFIFRPDSTGYPANPVTWSIVVWQDQNTGGTAARAGALVADAAVGD